MAEEQKQEAKTTAITRAPVQVRLGMIPTDLDVSIRMAKNLALSTIIPTRFFGKEADVLAAIMWGSELGIPPMSALKGIAVINGVPSLFGDLFLSVIVGHPDYEDHEEVETGKNTDDWSWTCTFYRKGKKPISRSFGKKDAITAKLWGKAGPWTTNPGRMMQMRSRGFAGRDRFADALAGLAIKEEVEDYAIDNPADPSGKSEIMLPRRMASSEPIGDATVVPDAPGGVVESMTRTVEDVDRKVEEKLGGKPTIEQFATGKVAEAVKQAVQQPADMLDVMHEAQTGHAEPSVQQQSEAVQREADLSMGDDSIDDFDKVVPIKEPAPEPEKKLKKDMPRPIPKRSIAGTEYEKIKPMHAKKLHVVLASSKAHTEKEFYTKLWNSWGIESTNDIPLDSYKKVLSWCAPDLKIT